MIAGVHHLLIWVAIWGLVYSLVPPSAIHLWLHSWLVQCTQRWWLRHLVGVLGPPTLPPWWRDRLVLRTRPLTGCNLLAAPAPKAWLRALCSFVLGPHVQGASQSSTAIALMSEVAVCSYRNAVNTATCLGIWRLGVQSGRELSFYFALNPPAVDSRGGTPIIVLIQSGILPCRAAADYRCPQRLHTCCHQDVRRRNGSPGVRCDAVVCTRAQKPACPLATLGFPLGAFVLWISVPRALA